MPAEMLMKGRVHQRNVGRARDGTELLTRLMRDGSQITADWFLALALEGRIFVANYGQAITAITCKTGWTPAQPDVNLDIPNGTSVIPLAFHLACFAMAGTVNHFFLQGCTGNVVGNGTSTVADSLVSVFQGQGPFNTACTARKAYSGSGTAPGTGGNNNPGTVNEFFSFEQTAASAAGSANFYDWSNNFVLPSILTGPASISGYGVSTSTAMQVKAILTYLEFPSDLLAG